ncbi:MULTISPECIES: hypothetical protein [unclassified Streptomyces]|uniref:hypothetical protein n=1 Tax=unclassified Streptomyces TaxID=2593676 RepID=UPI001F3FB51C|nr:MULTISPECIES: hypothetical protein [unclassified Streptomyces]
MKARPPREARKTFSAVAPEQARLIREAAIGPALRTSEVSERWQPSAVALYTRDGS